MSRQALDELKRQIPLLDYLQAHDWQPARQLSRGRMMGLCPLHPDRKPSFLVDPSKSLFYCYGCGRGGDVIRFAELYHQVKFPQALALLHQWRGLAPLLHEAAGFYRMQLHRHGEAIAYLNQRGVRSPEVIEHMRIGYAPGGGCLRRWLTQLGYPLPAKSLMESDGRRVAGVHRADRAPRIRNKAQNSFLFRSASPLGVPAR
jgi:DNA primase